jgi:hypothetical protein
VEQNAITTLRLARGGRLLETGCRITEDEPRADDQQARFKGVSRHLKGAKR